MGRFLDNRAVCPGCHDEVDGFLGVTGNHIPKEGDFSVCFRCQCVSRYQGDLSLRKATVEETPPEVARAIERAKAAITAACAPAQEGQGD